LDADTLSIDPVLPLGHGHVTGQRRRNQPPQFPSDI
jgi:hypothetical protein